MEKFCPACEQNKNIETEFNKRPNGKPTSYCKLCQRNYCKKDYSDNKTRHNLARYERRKRERAAMRDHIEKLKEQSCHDCKLPHPKWRLEFDHARGKKKFDIAHYAHASSWKDFLKEIEKCDVVCANCHKDRTHVRQTGV